MKRDLTEDQLRQEVTVALPLSVLLRIGEEPKPGAAVLSNRTLPAIGSKLELGIFAGVTLHNDDLFGLELLPGDFNGTWAEAKDWADKEGGVLPSRHDQLVLFRNVKGEFKDAYYWSGEQPAGDPDYAWCQGFGDGTRTGAASAAGVAPARSADSPFGNSVIQ
jgi:hypothetical protein